MAFLLRPTVFAPAYCGPTACYAPSRPARSYARPSSSLVPFLSQVDDLMNELQRETRRAARVERQRRRILNPRFDIKETQEGYQVDGEVPGFEQENIEIEVSDQHTLSIKASTERKAEQQQEQQEQPQAETAAATEPESEKIEDATVTETEIANTPEASETGSVKSYQATVEDDFEDLGAEPSSNLSTSSKGEDKAVESAQPAPTTTETAQAQPEPQQQEQESENSSWLNERVHGSFTRTFRFPSRIDGANVRASLKNGVLSIQVPKAPVPEVRHIMIQ